MARCVAVGAVLAVVVAGCARSTEGYYGTTEPRHGPDVIWTNLGSEPEWIDPGKCSDSAGSTIVFNAFEGLTQPHPATLEPMPAIAKGWDVTDGGRRYVFHLRESAWSDGTPLTAHDFEYSWKRVLSRETASRYASFLYPVRHAATFHQLAVLVRGLPAEGTEARLRTVVGADVPIESVEPDPELGGALVVLGGEEDGKEALRERAVKALDGAILDGARLQASIVDASIVGVRALDDRTLEVRLEDPLPYFLHLVSFYTAMPVPRHVLERLAREGKNPDLWTRPEHVVSNGAYVIAEWKFRQYYLLEKNTRYWDAATVRTPRIRLALVENSNTTLNLYEAGELDYIGEVALPNEFTDSLRRYHDFRIGPFLASYFYWVNTKAAPFDSPLVRKAFKLAIDRRAIVEHVTRGGQIPSADLTPDGVAGYRGPRSELFDPDEARALLAEAGYPGGKGFPAATLVYNTSEGHKQIAEAVQQMWKDELGVHVELENQEWKVFLKRTEAMEFQIARMGWIGDYPDPFTFLELLMPGIAHNRSNWNDARYGELMVAANRESDRARRLELMRQAEAHAMEATPVIPIYVYTRPEVIKPYLMGNWLNYQHRQLFKYWWIDERWYDGVPVQVLEDEPPPVRAPEVVR